MADRKRSLMDRIRDMDLQHDLSIWNWSAPLDRWQGWPGQHSAMNRHELMRENDEDLLELIGSRPDSREGQIAASIIRTREAWRTPARWSVILAVLALLLSAAAFIRTL